MSISNHEGESDRELTELAAKAAGWKGWRSKHGYWNVTRPDGTTTTCCVGWTESTFFDALTECDWYPLGDDGDAFRLAVRLNIDLCPHGSAAAHRIDMDEGGFAIRIIEAGSKDERENARRAIVRVAAEIGRSMP